MKKKKSLVILSAVFFVLLFVAGGTLAYWIWKPEANKNVVFTTSGIDDYIVYDEGDSHFVGNFQPADSFCDSISTTISLYKTGEASGIDLRASIFMDINSIGTNIAASNDVHWVITEGNSTVTCDEGLTSGSVINSGTFNGKAASDIITLASDLVVTLEEKQYTVWIWIDATGDNLASLSGETVDTNVWSQIDIVGDASAGTLLGDVSEPVLDSGMIPVTISNDGTVTTISSEDSEWYDYSQKKWANAILVSSSSRETYLNTSDIVVNQDDILAYYTWIPRYKYRIWTKGISSTNKEQQIEIVFEKYTTPKSLGTKVGEYRTHPAFTFGDMEIPGFWVGKFETSTLTSSTCYTNPSATNCNNANQEPRILPNVSSLRYQSINNKFRTSLKFAGGTFNSDGSVSFNGNNTYGLTNNSDSHMMKNSEWGAVAYLSHSLYGINDEVFINNSAGYYTGRSGGNVSGNQNDTLTQFDMGDDIRYNSFGYYTWLGQEISFSGVVEDFANNRKLGTSASTTGNVTGIYDMVGGAWEYVMGNYGNTVSSAELTVFPSSKYYDLYSSEQFKNVPTTDANLCTLETCGGHALYETNGWYSDYGYFASNVSGDDGINPWFIRGGGYDGNEYGGIFYFNDGNGGNGGTGTFRSVIVPITDQTGVDSENPIATISSTKNVKSTEQTVTLTCSDSAGVTSYYFGTSISPSKSDYTKIDSTTSMTINKTISKPGVYYLVCSDGANSHTSNLEFISYVVQNRMLSPNGVSGEYNSTNYQLSSSYTYLIPNDTYISRSGSMTVPAGADSSTYAASVYNSIDEIPDSGVATTVDSVTVSKSKDVVVIWIGALNYTISYNYCGGESGPTNQSKRYGSTLKLSDTSAILRGSTFLGWSLDGCDAASATYRLGGSFTINSNSTLYAIYKDAEDDNVVYSYICNNNSQGVAPYDFTYTGNCEVSGLGTSDWKVKFLTDGDFSSNINIDIDAFLVGGGSNGGAGLSGVCVENCSTSSSAKYSFAIGSGGSGGKSNVVSINLNTSSVYGIDIGNSGSETSAFNVTTLDGKVTGTGGSGTSITMVGSPSVPSLIISFLPHNGRLGVCEFLASSCDTSLRYAGGGGSGGYGQQYNRVLINGIYRNIPYGLGGSGGGGNGSVSGDAQNGEVNTGGGGGGTYSGTPGIGGSGVVVIRRAHTYKINYNLNGGSGLGFTQSKRFGETIVLMDTIPTRVGYAFIEWNTKADGTGKGYAPGDSYSEESDLTLYAIWEIDVNKPILDEGMIPVVIADNGTVTTVSADDNSWYNYFNQEWSSNKRRWANAVLVKENATEGVEGSKSRDYYLSNPGTEVVESDILAYYVWIPRYSYKIWTNTSSAKGNEQEVEIKFESRDAVRNIGKNVDEYRTHPAFTFGDMELSGIWFGKFETTGSTTEPTIKPNQSSLRSQTFSNMFRTSLKFANGTLNDSTGVVTFDGGNFYGLTNKANTHMSKNIEWGAVAYLAHSKHGINQEVRINNYYASSSTKTGCGAGTVDATNATTCGIPYGTPLSSEENTYPQSTTGNITGVFDMSGGAHDFVMINLKNDLQNSGFSVMPESKYYDLRTGGSPYLTACDGGLCYGDATFETAEWYNDTLGNISADYPFAGRGGIYSDTNKAGIFRLNVASGASSANWGSRSVLLVVEDTYDISYDGNCPSGTASNVPLTQTKNYGSAITLSSQVPVCDGYTFLGWSTDRDASNYMYNSGSDFVTNADTSLYAIWMLNHLDPVLDAGMIPVIISDDGTTKTILEDDPNWYDYANKKWANIVLVDEDSRNTYLDTTGVTVNQDDILAYYVWIPRYKYRIWTDVASAAGKEQTIEIIFETNDMSKSFGEGIGEYRTHPAFTFGDLELSGIWVGKFELTGTIDEPTIKPNVSPIRTQTLSTFFNTSLKFSGGLLTDDTVTFSGNNIYGLSAITDSHVSKNSEWGAVAYLAHSQYGINEEVRLNNQNTYTTGCGATSANGAGNATCQNKYGTVTVYPQSTTGNVTGVFDMAGGANEYVMANYNNTKASSGFSVMPESKYYDLYTTNSYLTACNGGLCYGDASFETAGWYSDVSEFPTSTDSNYWLVRGGYYTNTTTAGIFNANNMNGGSNAARGTRSVLVVGESKYEISYNANGGRNAPSSQIKDYGVSLTLSSQVPTRDGYTFVGWSSDSNASKATYGAGDNFTINASMSLYAVWIINDHSPKLDVGMIPVTISDDGTVTVVSEDDSNWYDYANKKWANVVLVQQSIEKDACEVLENGVPQYYNCETSTRIDTSTYMYEYRSNIKSGDIIPEEHILAYYVWIPRYKYRIWTNVASAEGKEQEIEIQFENSGIPKSMGTNIGEYRTHPAFTFGDTELDGIWVGKFELTGNVDEPTVKPNVGPLRNLTLSAFFNTSLLFSGGTMDTSTGDVLFSGNSYYGLSGVTDSHVSKNSEWGAVAYLAHSQYGINEEVRLNNQNSHTTGCGATSANGAGNATCQNKYGTVTVYPQSTTGNVTGVFDMAGLAFEYVMANYNNTKASSGFSVMPESKYYDLYTTTSYLTACNGGLCYGDASFETAGWYGDMSEFPTSTNSAYWLLRGGYYGSGVDAGIFYANNIEGGANVGRGTRVSLAVFPTNSYTVKYNMNGGTGSISSQSKYHAITLKLSDNVPTRTGYQFLGWSLESDATTPTFEAGGNFTINGNNNGDVINLYAVWQLLTVSFDANGGNLEMITLDSAGAETYTIPYDGIYKLETWGAQGGSGMVNGVLTYEGGYGAYSVGNIYLDKDTNLYLNVGGAGSDPTDSGYGSNGGYNGGGKGANDSNPASTGNEPGSGGGGATHISLIPGELSSLKNRIDNILIVAGGGGGGAYTGMGGHGGGIKGNSSYKSSAVGGSQSSGNAFGVGGVGKIDTGGGSGGGGGFYGGFGGVDTGDSGAGGSGYIGNSLLTNKAMYCFNCTTSDDLNTLTYSVSDSSVNLTSNYAKKGDGGIKITYLGSQFEYGVNYGELPVPTRTGYKFLGWNTKADGSGDMITSSSIVTINGSHTLYAIWENILIVNYDANGGSLVKISLDSVGAETYTIPYDGIYKLEAWGAQGGSAEIIEGGYGGYSVGSIQLDSGTDLYLNVGGKGTDGIAKIANCKVMGGVVEDDGCKTNGGYNGGGFGFVLSNYPVSGGGGATHIATVPGMLSTLKNNKANILIVAGGGGGVAYNTSNTAAKTIKIGHGGGTRGNTSKGVNTANINTTSSGGTQRGFGEYPSVLNYKGNFGQGGSGNTSGLPGGGGGLYGGNVSSYAAGGGSGYIGNKLLMNKAMYSYDGYNSSTEAAVTYAIMDVSDIATPQYAKKGDGAIKVSIAGKEIAYGSIYGELPMLERDGYTFLEWNTKPDGSGETITSSTIVDINEIHTIYAIWKESNLIEFDPNGGSLTTIYSEPGAKTYITPLSGLYQFEVWGAQGGSANTINGGYGGYSVGRITLTSDTNLYVNVGGKGENGIASANYTSKGGYNGGGDSYVGSAAYPIGGGGGATHIATINGQLFELKNASESNVLIVAGGGGGVAIYNSSAKTTLIGHGGGYKGNDSSGKNTSGDVFVAAGALYNKVGSGGKYIGSFGQGASGKTSGHVGGGGGFYGGNSSAYSAGGGSGYIGNLLLRDKVMYCYDCLTSNKTNTRTNSTTNVSSVATSNYAKIGDGTAKITIVGKWLKIGDAYGTLPEPVREGYVFDSWNTKADGSGTIITSNTELTKNGKVTLYAIWK